METNTAPWQERFGLTICPATAVAPTIPAAALGVAVIYAAPETGEQILLIIESRAKPLLGECERRLQTAKLPPLASLSVAFKAETLPDASAEAVHAACRAQVILAGELRRELRPAMR
ncbi:MAG: hypothetical protein NTV51_16325 [Verrucomicrobia bacterium]|nr:hypothetical protein [Verrucomicrobiota bacterium]